jgi:stress response protein YsnF
MLTEREVSASIGGTAYSTSGDKIGTVDHYFVDDRTGAPTWVAVTTGLFGTRHSIVPAQEAMFSDGALRVPVSVDAVKNAPQLRGSHLDPDEEALLRRHYGLGELEGTAGTGTDAPLPPPPASYGTAEPDPSYGAGTAPAGAPGTGTERTGTDVGTDAGMVRSEERLRISTGQVAATRVRLVKYVVTEEVQITVPIRREEIRIEEVPIDAEDPGPGESLVDDGHGAHSGSPGTVAAGSGQGAGLPAEIVLHTERPVVGVEVVPRERVRLRTELVQGQETVTGQVQREQIVVDQTPAPGSASR